MSQSGASAEPSMEEILASIRQIISDDEPADGQSEPAEDSAPEMESGEGEAISESDLDALFASDDPEPAAEDTSGFDAVVPDEPADTNQIDFDAIGVDDDPEPAAEAEPEDDDDDDDDDEVLELGAVAQPMEDPFEPEEDLDFADAVAEPEPEPVAPEEPDAESMVEPEPQPESEPDYSAVNADAIDENARTLLSNDAGQAVSVAFADLAQTMLSGNARTLEDLVQDMLRPMLKGWLDENLPTMVEKMVREEIERVARRGPRP